MKKLEWTKKEKLFLIENYSNLTNNKLSLNKTIWTIPKKSKLLSLKKSKEHINKIILNKINTNLNRRKYLIFPTIFT